MVEIPDTIVTCAGCGKDLSVLQPYIKVQLKVERQVIQATNPDPGQDAIITLGTQSGSGEQALVHDFSCLLLLATSHKDDGVEIETHVEEGEAFVPVDNRLPAELVAAGEMSEAHATLVSGTA